MNERSGNLPSVDLAVRLSSACDKEFAKDVLLASSPNWRSCSSMLFCFFPVWGVDGWDDVCCEVEDACPAMASCSVLPPSSRSSESIQVERLTTSCSLRTSSWMEVSCLLWACRLRSRPSKSASRMKEAPAGSGRRETSVYNQAKARLLTFYALPNTNIAPT